MANTARNRLHAPPLHRAARIEDTVYEVAEKLLPRHGRLPAVVPYTSYGAPGWVRVLARVIMTRPERRLRRHPEKIRGWRNFVTWPATHAPVMIEVGGRRCETRADRSGFVDVVLDADLPPGWASMRLSTPGAQPVYSQVLIVDPSARFGILSDIDDTVMVTALPRPLLAAWNTFIVDEHARMAVPGMAVLFERLTTAHPGAPVFYLSTGSWNVVPTLTRFLARHLYPRGPLLLTNWGPTPDRWFRSGREHKRASLRRLAREFPAVRWLLVGDDGQHDEEIYAEFVASHPDNVAGVAIRRLSPTQSLLAGTLPSAVNDVQLYEQQGKAWLRASDGAGLWRLLQDTDL
jgi:phosphatidate phosphatase APP1